MPTYEYSCPKCGTFEAFQKITENALAECPTCHSPVERLISGSAFHLKGTGWYKTDYAAKSPPPSGAPASDSKSGESKPAEGGNSEPKNEAKKDAPAEAAKPAAAPEKSSTP